MGFFNAAGEDKKLAQEQEAKRAEWHEGAIDSFYNTEKSDALKADLDKRMADIGARRGAGEATAQKTTFGAGAFGSASKVGPVATMAGTKIERPDAAARVGQAGALDAFAAGMAGNGPSVAPAQMQQSTDAALAAFARARAAKGARVNPALANIPARAEMGAMLHEGQLGAATSRAREANDAAQKFGAMSAAVREQDIGAATAQAKMNQEAALTGANAWNTANLANKGFADQMSGFNAGTYAKQAKMQQEVELANMQAELQAKGMNDAQIAHYLSQFQRQQMLDKNAEKAFWEHSQENDQFDEKQSYQKQKDMQAKSDAQFSAAASALTLGLKASDKRAKRDVKPGDKAVSGWLDELKAYDYEYKDPSLDGAAPGRHLSVMAQDLEKSDVTKSAVTTGEDGVKRVDYGRLAGVSLAAMVDMHKRLKAVEKRKGK